MVAQFAPFANTTIAATTSPSAEYIYSSSATAITVPSPILVPITTGPPTASAPHDPISTYSNAGSLLKGYCASTEYVLLNGLSTAFWAPAVGCVGDKPDCCPYAVASRASIATITLASASTITVGVDPSGANSPYAGVQAYPTPASSNQASLLHCPDDYETVLGGCCPSGYKLWDSLLGGATPCYSSLSTTLVPPPVPVTSNDFTSTPSPVATTHSTTTKQKPTSAIADIVYAVQYTLQPSLGLSSGAKAGIGVGAGIGGVVAFTLTGFLIWKAIKRKKTSNRMAAMQQVQPRYYE